MYRYIFCGDFTILKVYDIHKTFKNYAIKGKSSMGWSYGVKLHIINDKGKILCNGFALRKQAE